jgi:dTDP-glucose 4,6-dehydratase
MKIVYITGCLGFIGSYVTQACLDKGWYVHGIDNYTYASNVSKLNDFSKYSKFKFEKIDICDISRLFDCDYFINTAAETHVDNSIRKSDDFVHSNIV